MKASAFFTLLSLAGLGQSQAPVAGQVVRIRQTSTNANAELFAGNAAPGAQISLYATYTNNIIMYNQYWHLVGASKSNPSAFRIQNIRTGTYMTLDGGSSSDGTLVQGYPLTGGANQTWFFQAEGGSYRIMSKASGTCLSTADNTGNNGVLLQGVDCQADPAIRLWTFPVLSQTSAQLKTLMQTTYPGAHVSRYTKGTKTIFVTNADGIFGTQVALGATQGRVLSDQFDGLDLAWSGKLALDGFMSGFTMDPAIKTVSGVLYANNPTTPFHAFNWYLTETSGVKVSDPQTETDSFDLTGWTVTDVLF